MDIYTERKKEKQDGFCPSPSFPILNLYVLCGWMSVLLPMCFGIMEKGKDIPLSFYKNSASDENIFFGNAEQYRYHCLKTKNREELTMFKKLFALLLTLVLAVGCTGCHSMESPETAMENFLESIKTQDNETTAHYLGTTSDRLSELIEELKESDEGSDTVLISMLSNFTYEIVSTKETEDSAEVKVAITNTDMTEIMAEVIRESFMLALSDVTQEEMNAELNTLMLTKYQEKKDNVVTNTVNITMKKREDGWVIKYNEEFSDAVLGGFISYMDDFNSSFQ